MLEEHFYHMKLYTDVALDRCGFHLKPLSNYEAKKVG